MLEVEVELTVEVVEEGQRCFAAELIDLHSLL